MGIAIILLFIATITSAKLLRRILHQGNGRIFRLGGSLIFTEEYCTNGEYVPPSAYVYGVEGSFYEVDLTIE